MVLRRCRRLLRDENEALDACQDVFVRLLVNRTRLDGAYPSSLLFRIATNVCLNRIRDRKRRPESPDEELLASIASAESPGGALVSGRVILLDQSYELDDAPGIERFYFVTGETPFLVAPVMETARKAARHPPAALPLARELSQSTFSIQKEVKP